MFYLGIDGGGTGCRARLEDAAGRVFGEAQAGPANIATDRDGALANILAAASGAMSGVCDPHQVIAGLGLAGASLTAPRDWIAQRLPFQSAQIVQDVETSLIGALGEADGILAAIGTGSVFAAQRFGRSRVIGGWGLRLGDEASGAWIGRELCRSTLAAFEGSVPRTPILQSLLDQLGGPQGIVAFGSTAAPADFAAFAPMVIAGEASGDPAAIAVMDAARKDIAAAIAVLQSDGAGLPVVFLGGLGSYFAQHFASARRIIPPLGEALDGAVALARRGIK